MGITAFSFVLLPLCLLWITSPRKLLFTIPLFAIFEAAAAFTIGSLGVQPGLVPAITFIGFMLLQMLLGAHFSGQSEVWRIVRPFVAVTLWAVVSSFLMPWMFEGMIYVWPQKTSPPFVLSPLAPNEGNLHQDIYLILNCVFLVLAAIFFSSRGSLLPYIRSYLLSGFVAAAISVWELGNKVAGLPFPTDIFYSNPGMSILTDQSIGAVPRINGPFTEPSSLAAFMSSIVCSTGWLMLQGHRENMIRWLFVVGLLTIILSTSTTGFGVLAIVGVGVPAVALVTGSFRIATAILRVSVPLILALGLLFFTAQVFIPHFDDYMQDVISATLAKQGSSSYDDRTSADLDSLAAMVESYGLGVGWGSNRSSSLGRGLLAGLGIPGCLALIWFGFSLTRDVRRARRLRCTSEQLLVMDGCCGALVGFLLAAGLAGPSINSMTFFFLLGLLIAGAARVAKPAVKPSIRTMQALQTVPPP